MPGGGSRRGCRRPLSPPRRGKLWAQHLRTPWTVPIPAPRLPPCWFRVRGRGSTGKCAEARIFAEARPFRLRCLHRALVPIAGIGEKAKAAVVTAQVAARAPVEHPWQESPSCGEAFGVGGRCAPCAQGGRRVSPASPPSQEAPRPSSSRPRSGSGTRTPPNQRKRDRELVGALSRLGRSSQQA